MAILTPTQAMDKMDAKADRAIRALALELTKRVVMRTPVDTGRARGNWFGRIGQPERRTTEATDPRGSATIAKGQAIIHRFTMGESYFLTNGLPYILPLEHGHSKQAPAGMVTVTVAELQPTATAIARRLVRQ